MEKSFTFQAGQERLQSALPKLQRLADLQDKLRDCVSANDVRTSQQRLWIARHQHGDLEQRLASGCRQLQADMEMLPAFNQRYDSFMGWADDLEKKLDNLQDTSKVSHMIL